MLPLQQEPEFRQMERLLDMKGRRSQNWERTPQDRLGKTGLEEFKALQADCDDTGLAIRFQTLNQLVMVSHNALMPTVYVCRCVPHFSFQMDMLQALFRGSEVSGTIGGDYQSVLQQHFAGLDCRPCRNSCCNGQL